MAGNIIVFCTVKAEAQATVEKLNAKHTVSKAKPTVMTHKHFLRTTVNGRECFRAVVRERGSREKVYLGTTASIAGAATFGGRVFTHVCQ